MSETGKSLGPVNDFDKITVPEPLTDGLSEFFQACKSKAKDDDLQLSLDRQKFVKTMRKFRATLEGINESVIDTGVENLLPELRRPYSWYSASARSGSQTNEFIRGLSHPTEEFFRAVEALADDRGAMAVDDHQSAISSALVKLAELRKKYLEFPHEDDQIHPAFTTAAMEIEEAIIQSCGSDLNDDARRDLEEEKEKMVSHVRADRTMRAERDESTLRTLNTIHTVSAVSSFALSIVAFLVGQLRESS